MKKIKILTSVLLLGCVFFAYAQEPEAKPKTMMDILCSTDWEGTNYYDHSPVRGIISYDETMQTSYTVPKDKQQDITRSNGMKYYFSEELDTVFDEKNVGKATSGKYIIFKRNAFEIITISEKELIFKLIVTEPIVGGSNSLIFRYIPAEKDWRGGRSEISLKESLRRSGVVIDK